MQSERRYACAPDVSGRSASSRSGSWRFSAPSSEVATDRNQLQMKVGRPAVMHHCSAYIRRCGSILYFLPLLARNDARRRDSNDAARPGVVDGMKEHNHVYAGHAWRAYAVLLLDHHRVARRGAARPRSSARPETYVATSRVFPQSTVLWRGYLGAASVQWYGTND